MQKIEIPEITFSPSVLQTLSPARLDALKEVANIGAGHAATALSMMTGARIMIDVPAVNVGQLSELFPGIVAPKSHMVSVIMDMHGSLNGQTLLLLPTLTARRLTDLMLRRERRAGAEAFDVLEQSALKEAGNILGGAYMNALSEFLSMQLLPSPPRFAVATAETLLSQFASLLAPDLVVCCVETEFSFEEVGERFRGFFLLLPDSQSFAAIFRAVHLS